MSEQPYKYLDFNILEAALKRKFGRITAYFEVINRAPSYWYKAKKTGSFRVRDLEAACDAAGITPADVMGSKLVSDSSILANAEISLRLKLFINNTGGDILDFAKKTGIRSSELKSIVEKGHALDLDSLRKILQHYPDLNCNWLLHGRGEITLNQKSLESLQVTIDTLLESLEDKKELIKFLKNKE